MATDARIAELEALIAVAVVERNAVGAGKPVQRIAINKKLRSLRLIAARLRGTHTDDEWRAKVLRFDFRCVRCVCKPPTLEKDHITPIYQGGSDGIENLQPLCLRCNTSKGRESTNWAAYRDAHGFEGGA